jgi:hypothetical protein
MQAGDPAMLAAMDGRESSTDIKTNGPSNISEEPTMFFFVIFGLIYEALATSSTESSIITSTRELTVIAALQTLKCLVRPKYSGKALLEPTTFDEFISLCYRMAMTETAPIQCHLVEMVIALAESQDQRTQAAGKIEYVYRLVCHRIGLKVYLLVMMPSLLQPRELIVCEYLHTYCDILYRALAVPLSVSCNRS